MTAVRSERLDSLLGTISQLYPKSDIKLAERMPAQTVGFRLVPSSTNPRLAVPAQSAQAAQLTVQRPCASDTFVHTARRTALGLLLRLRYGRKLMPAGIGIADTADSIEQTLSEIYGHPVLIGLMTGSARANRKPVLSIFTAEGQEVGFAKLGLGELAAQLITDEYSALSNIAARPHPAFTAPSPIALAQFEGNPLLVMTSVRPDIRQRGLWLPTAAAKAVVHYAPVYTTKLGTSPWLNQLNTTLAGLGTAEGRQLELLLKALVRKYRATPVRFGGAHGDFGPWNMGRQSGKLCIWDWERFSPDMPAGLDLYHFAAHEKLRTATSSRTVSRIFHRADLRAGILRLQGNLQAQDAQMDLLPLMYLATIAARFISDGHHYQVPDTYALGISHLRLAEELLATTQGEATHV